MNDWIIWQFVDSAFPIGGFAHSAGLEAAWYAGHVTDGTSLEQFLQAQLWQWAHTIVPLAVRSYRTVADIDEIEALCDLILNHPVANRASRAQGRALMSTAIRVFPEASLIGMHDRLREMNSPHHMAPVFGAICRKLDVTEEQMARMLLFVQLRGVVSAAVRLGICGSIAGQAMQRRRHQDAEAMVNAAINFDVETIAQTAPLTDLFQASHDRLYSRLFQS